MKGARHKKIVYGSIYMKFKNWQNFSHNRDLWKGGIEWKGHNGTFWHVEMPRVDLGGGYMDVKFIELYA